MTTWFVAVETAAPIVGSLLSHILPNLDPAATLRSALLITMGAGVVAMTLAGRDAAGLTRSGWAVAAISLFLGIDNLVAGAALPLGSATVCGMASAVPVLGACVLARLVGARLPPVGRAVTCGVLLTALGMTGLV
jgi:hypothetical protein